MYTMDPFSSKCSRMVAAVVSCSTFENHPMEFRNQSIRKGFLECILRNLVLLSAEYPLIQCFTNFLHFTRSTPQFVKNTRRHTTKFCLMKRGYKTIMAINMCLHINPCPMSVQAYENKKITHVGKTIDDEPVCIRNSNYERKDTAFL
jgi:hypothetical protein